MANEKLTYKERKQQRKKAFARGYVNGYEDALKSIQNNRHVSTKAYGNGYKDSRTVITINKKFNKYRNIKWGMIYEENN